MDLAAARPGMRRVELVVATPAAVAVQIGPHPVEEAAGALCAQQRPEAQVYLVQEALAVLYARRPSILPPPAGVVAGAQFAPLEVALLLLKLQEEALAPHLNCLGQRDQV